MYFTPQGNDQPQLISRAGYSSQGDAAGEVLPFFAVVIGGTSVVLVDGQTKQETGEAIMRKSDLKVGKVIYFGTKAGPRTRAKITRLSSKSITVKSLAKRGDRPVGSIWRVGYENLFATKGVMSAPKRRVTQKKVAPKRRVIPKKKPTRRR